MNTVIIEDETQVTETLKLLLNRYCPEVKVAGTASTFAEAYDICNTIQPELVFCDIQLNSEEGTGLDLIQLLNRSGMKVIFITGWKDFAIDAFRVNAIDYLLKPVNVKDLTRAVEKAMQQQITQKTPALGNLHIPTQHGFLLAPLTELVRCQAEGPYTHFFLSGKTGKKTSAVNLGVIADKLPHDYFFRVHKTHIINRSHILEYIRGEGGIIRMSDNAEIPISRLHKDEFMKWLG